MTTTTTMDNTPEPTLPEGIVLVPEDLRGDYVVLAYQQMAMCMVSMADLFMQATATYQRIDQGKVNGIVMGLERAILFIQGQRRA